MSTEKATASLPKEDGKSTEDPYLAELVQIRTRVTRISIKVTAIRHTLYFIAVMITLIGVLHLILK
jgi:hypothetical protein